MKFLAGKKQVLKIIKFLSYRARSGMPGTLRAGKGAHAGRGPTRRRVGWGGVRSQRAFDVGPGGSRGRGRCAPGDAFGRGCHDFVHEVEEGGPRRSVVAQLTGKRLGGRLPGYSQSGVGSSRQTCLSKIRENRVQA